MSCGRLTLGIDGVEEGTEYLNNIYTQEVPENVSNDEKEGGEDDSGRRKVEVPPPYSELSSHFHHLETIAKKYGMQEAAFHIEKARMAMINAHASKPVQQTDIRAFASPPERDM
ncbi:unnamed protein product [Choristocarpus tenellus]